MNHNQGKFVGQTALVTGAARRIGRAIALALARSGCNVAIHYYTHSEEADTLAEEIGRMDCKAWVFQADLRDSDQAESLMDRAVQKAGAVDILINNASIFPSDTVMNCTIESLMENIALHAVSPLVMCRRMARQDRSGQIVNLLDSRIEDYDCQHASYHLSKRMLLALTRMLATELAPRIRVNAVAPGLILPPEGKDESYLKQLSPTNLLQTYGQPGDVIHAVLFLLGAEFITGQIIYVDGGRHVKGKMYG
jgi:NAD(P)-dependent dehydrogenase (short-subunit alcohol dehydrogenase family)